MRERLRLIKCVEQNWNVLEVLRFFGFMFMLHVKVILFEDVKTL